MADKPYRVLFDTRERTIEQWRAERMRGIGGSEAGAILGMNPHRTPIQVYLEKTGQAEPFEGNEATTWGTRLEPMIRNAFPEEYLLREQKETAVAEYPFMLQSTEHPFMLANVDGQMIDPVYGNGGLEVKLTSVLMAKAWEHDRLPDTYYAQVQHYAAVTGWPYFMVVALIGYHLEWRYVPRNEEFIGKLIATEQEFWERHVLGDELPEPSGKTADSEALASLYPSSTDEVVELPPELERVMGEYLVLKDQISAKKERKTQIAQRIKAHLGEAKVGSCGPYKATWSRFDKEQVDVKRLKVEEAEVWKRFRKVTPGNRFDVTEATQR